MDKFHILFQVISSTNGHYMIYKCLTNTHQESFNIVKLISQQLQVSNRCSEVNDEASKKYKFGGISRTEFVNAKCCKNHDHHRTFSSKSLTVFDPDFPGLIRFFDIFWKI